MRSWILRHRLRLRLIYGPAPDARELAGTALGATPARDGAPAPAGSHGRVRRSAHGLEVVPMPRRVGRTRHVG